MSHLRLIVSNSSCCDGDAPRGQMSRPKVLDRHRVRVISSEVWSAFVRARFRNPEAVATYFEVRFQTACNWWHAVNRPSADKVMIAALELPEFLDHLAAAVDADARRAA